MATSGTTDFNPDIAELVEEAYDRVGVPLRSGYQLKKARRSLNYAFADLANHGLNTWTLEERTQSLTEGTAEYTLDTDFVDIAEAVVRNDNNTDTPVERMSLPEYSSLADKTTKGQPSRFYLYRTKTPKIVLWPTPDDSDDTLVFWVWRQIEDAGAYTNNMDVPFRYFDALASALAYRVGVKEAEVSPQKLKQLQADMMEAIKNAENEDRDRADLTMRPDLSAYSRL